MKVSCPRCGRGTVLDEELGDFPTRCTRCGALVRRRSEPGATDDATPPSSTRIQRGMLAGMLISRSAPPSIIHANPAAAESPRAGQSVLRPESRQEILRARTRQQALVKAELRGNQQALGALTWAGLVLVGMLGIGALGLKVHDMWQHPTPSRADVLQVSR